MALRLVSGNEGQGPRLPDEQRVWAAAHATWGQELQRTDAVMPDPQR